MPVGSQSFGPSLAPGLAAVSVLLALGAAYTGLAMAARVRVGRGWNRSAWAIGGTAAVGVGIWSAHYVDMLAARLPVPVWYHWPTVLASLATAGGAAAAAILTLGAERRRFWAILTGSTLAAGGIAIAHFFSEDAMRLAATRHHDVLPIALSTVLAVGLCYAACSLAFVARDRPAGERLRWRLLCTLLLGAAMPTVHYASVAATHFGSSAASPALTHAVNGSILGAMAVSVVTVVVFALAVLTAMYDERLFAQRAALRSAEERYRDLFHRSPAGILRARHDGRIVDCNAAAARMLGFDAPADLIGTSMIDRYPDPAARAALLERVASARIISDLERPLLRKDGGSIWVLSTVTMIDAGDGDPTYDSTMIDVTDKKQLEQALAHAQKLEAVGSLAAGIAHEINTPVQFVSDNTQFLKEAFQSATTMVADTDRLVASVLATDPTHAVAEEIASARAAADWDYIVTEAPKALAQMQEGLARVAKIVAAMRAFSRVEQTGDVTSADMNMALDTTLTIARNEFKYVADVHTDYGALPPVACRLGDMNQVFLSLIVNAAHAIDDVVRGTDVRGRIDIRTRYQDGWVSIEVADTGAGIPTHLRDKVFNPFFTTKDVGGGTGQSLALARTIVVDGHGGMLTFESEAGKGTTFCIRLPVNRPARLNEALAA